MTLPLIPHSYAAGGITAGSEVARKPRWVGVNDLQPTAPGGLKILRCAEVPEQDEHLPLLSIYMAIVWRLVASSSEMWGIRSSRFLGGFKGWGL